jgi:hypothetical protein
MVNGAHGKIGLSVQRLVVLQGDQEHVNVTTLLQLMVDDPVKAPRRKKRIVTMSHAWVSIECVSKEDR